LFFIRKILQITLKIPALYYRSIRVVSIALPSGAADDASRLPLIKAVFSKALPKTERRSATRVKRGECGICPKAQVTPSGDLYDESSSINTAQCLSVIAPYGLISARYRVLQ
jgi:hypothetical protein